MPDETTTTAPGLLERAAELDALEGRLAQVREQRRGRLVLVAGEAGIGKTALLRALCGEGGLDRGHPLRLALGEIPREATDRIRLRPLSRDAVAVLAGTAGVDAGELHRRTGGNPFYVTEVVAAAGGAIPDTVRDAVLA